jgi:gephyrin
MSTLTPLSVERKRVELLFNSVPYLVYTEIEQVGSSLKGYIIAEDVYAPNDIPATRTTSVDGYALRCKLRGLSSLFEPNCALASDKPTIYQVLTSATHKTADELPEGKIYRINTGGPLPAGTDTVIMVEDTKLTRSVKDEHGLDVEELEVETLVSVPPGENVRQPGSDVKKGELALQKGDLLRSTGGEIGTLAFVGHSEVFTFHIYWRAPNSRVLRWMLSTNPS